MTEIKIEITDRQAREWRVALADGFKRRTGREPKANTSLSELCRILIMQSVANELSMQAAEAESEEDNG